MQTVQNNTYSHMLVFIEILRKDQVFQFTECKKFIWIKILVLHCGSTNQAKLETKVTTLEKFCIRSWLRLNTQKNPANYKWMQKIQPK